MTIHSFVCKHLFRLLMTIVCLSVTSVAFTVLAQEPEELSPLSEQIILFDGTDLNAWVYLSNDQTKTLQQVWQVEDGVLRCAGQPHGYLQTKRWYRDYELNLQWRWPGQRAGNSGVLVHTTTPLLFYGWPKSMEVQLQGSRAGDFWVIGKGVDIRVENEAQRRAKPVPGNQHTHRRISKLEGDFEKPIGEWNSMRVICRGDQVTVYVNDQLANHGTASTVTEGAIGLQSEGRPVEFRDIKLIPLTNDED